jgi:NAD-dependent SIR2 family protein deacetylase
VERLRLLLQGTVTVLTGAGVSTASGIPDYRGPNTRTRSRPPIQHREFMTSEAMRVRYWARSVLGWPRFRAFQPNPAHVALAELQRRGRVRHLITQNVDGLHQRAGSPAVLELHGSLAQVRCLACGERTPRDVLQARLLAENPGALAWTSELLPDGDAELPEEALRGFVVPACGCGGLLKPDVVFFGDAVPKDRLAVALAWSDEAEVLLVLGSSLMVYSGYRFVERARARGQRVAIVNRGPTRADALADLKLDAEVGEVLTALVRGSSEPAPGQDGADTLG